MDFRSPLRQVKGVGEKTEKLFQNLGVYTVGDILLHFPRTYEEYPEFCDVSDDLVGKRVALVGQLHTPAKMRKGRQMDITFGTFFVNSAPVDCVWFRMPYLSKQLPVMEPVVLYGVLTKEGHQYKMEQPTVFTPEKYEKMRSSLQPIYSLTKGLNNAQIRKVIQGVFSECEQEEEKILPAEVCQREDFPTYQEALRRVHFPDSFEELSKGRRRLVYQEFFYYILHSRMQEMKQGSVANPWDFEDTDIVSEVIKSLPYELTKGQMDTLEEVRRDLRGPFVSQRLIQGDVGSGKTIVAFLAMLDVVSNGHQAAIMAPTEVLARQHEESFKELCETYHLPYEVICLVGSMTAKEKRLAYENIEIKQPLFVVGTHALIQDKVNYGDLALVVTDEQHRFGVKQREALSTKGSLPHMLVMSATPIPRTLSMILYGNMAISAMTDMPKNRLPIKTCVIKERLRAKAYEMIRDEVAKGRQAYIICPLVEASDKTEAENVTDYEEKMAGYFPPTQSIGILHGKMPAKTKNAIMDDFAAGKIQILVSTTVVEVGVNVPNATVIMIENANRFGLAQLHQLRGRVGRGKHQSYCILMDQSKGEKVTERLEVMNKSNDGFFIAREDLRLRGPGDFFGIRQSGDLNFRIADIIGDADVLQVAASDVDYFLSKEDLASCEGMISQLELFERENRIVL